jgi:hypothetical protein
MEPRKLAPLTAAMLLVGMTDVRVLPRPWEAANNLTKPKTKSKNRDKVKAARKQRNRQK